MSQKVYRVARLMVQMAYIAAESPEEAQKAMGLLPSDEIEDQFEWMPWMTAQGEPGLFDGTHAISIIESDTPAEFTADYIFNKFGEGGQE